MKLLNAFLFCAALAASAGAQELKPLEDIPMPPHDPIASGMAQSLSVPLMFSSGQTSRLQKTLTREIDDKASYLVRQYGLQSDEVRKKRYEVRELLYKIHQLQMSLADSARSVLSPARREQLDPLIYEGRFLESAPKLSVVPQAEEGDEVVETTVKLPDGRIAKKKIIIRRKRKPETKPDFSDSAANAAAQLRFDALIYTPQP